MEQSYNDEWRGKLKCSEKTYPSATLSTADLIRTLEMNPVLLGVNPVTKSVNLAQPHWSAIEPTVHANCVERKISLHIRLRTANFLTIPSYDSYLLK
jgi:hypothetical protein